MSVTMDDILNGTGFKEADAVRQRAKEVINSDNLVPVKKNENNGWEAAMKRIEGYTPETEEQRKQREKRERSAKIIAGVGDMITSISNLVGTYNGAQSAYNPKEGLSAKMQERFDKMDAERKARDKDWYNATLHVKQLEDLVNHRKEQRRISEEHNKAIQDLRRQEVESRIKAAEERAEQSRREFEAKQRGGYFTKNKGGSGGGARPKKQKKGKDFSQYEVTNPKKSNTTDPKAKWAPNKKNKK